VTQGTAGGAQTALACSETGSPRWLLTSAATSGSSPPTTKAAWFGWISAHSSDDLLQSLLERKLPTQSLEGALRSALDGAKGHAGSPGYLPLREPSKIC
jgi:hypothetical protein